MLPFCSTDSETPQLGYRMHRLEVLNWGTFHQKVWTVRLDGGNALLTGDIGSGKSTLVDAVTTLLLPSNRIAYNKAAGAENKERTLRTYVLGHYKAERGESGDARPVALRKPGEYSVVLAVFRNEGFAEVTTLAQVFWFKDQHGQPERLYVCADQELSVTDDFRRVGGDIVQLRKRLRATEGVEVHDTFSAYAAAFRRRFHVPGEQAWELFHQTVSMKTVGNLTEFVREHMLQAPNVDGRIDDLLAHFDDLTRAHAAVARAKDQVGRLEPLVADCDAYEVQTAEMRVLRRCRDQLKSYFSGHKCQLLEVRMHDLQAEQERLIARKERRLEQRAKEQEEVHQLKRVIGEEGGDRLDQLDTELRLQQTELAKRRQRSRDFAARVVTLGAEMPATEEAFDTLWADLGRMREVALEAEVNAQNRLEERSFEFGKLRGTHQEYVSEIASLRLRPSNLPVTYVRLRARAAEALAIDAEDLPFAGELLQVREGEQAWEGALERLLRGFALSLLVREEHYARVARWVNETHLNGRLVYLRLLPSLRRPSSDPLQPASSALKLQVKENPRFAPWLGQELRERFDYACVSDQEQFTRAQRALSRTGQIKENTVRHVKDDRRPLEDRSQYVLGWSSGSKIAALDEKRLQLEAEMQRMGAAMEALRQARAAAGTRKEAIAFVHAVESFDQIDAEVCERTIARLQVEKERLESASDKLAELRGQLGDAQRMLAATEEALEKLHQEVARNMAKIEGSEAARQQAQGFVAANDEAMEVRIAEMHATLSGGAALTVESCDVQEHLVRNEFQRRVDAEAKQQERLKVRILLAMQSFRTAYPAESTEFDASVEAHAEYRKLLEQLRFHDLPRFEQRFGEELRKNTIQQIGLFHAKLDEQAREIEGRIRRINESLLEIEYNRGRYIKLLQDSSFRPEVQQFRADLRACTDNALYGGHDDQYAEEKFKQVKQILDRLRGRPEFASEDRRWRMLVTDVRHWFQFSASERSLEDDREWEHYSDSSGKSGGQKEKLAYTVLAASLAYQFGLEWVQERSRPFRFVVIDEAFGRGSDESAEFGLKLFRKLNLQLMVVTPLQKTHVIEPHVAHVAFVANQDNVSSVLNLSIQEHRRRKEERVQ